VYVHLFGTPGDTEDDKSEGSREVTQPTDTRPPVATTEMIQRLEAKDQVSYEPYEGASLTPSGREQVDASHETYVTLSWFSRSVPDLDAHEREAMRMAGLVSPLVTDRLAETLISTDGVRDEGDTPSSDCR
jgi:DtxR family Mn-dependent transcriptional regulator